MNASAGAEISATPETAPEAMTRPLSAPPASALVVSSDRWEAGSGLRFAALDPQVAKRE
ncbi:MAG: hypothetical protein JO223_22365 [Hyphomicrobiales bacterium]|nr:hypothetical protein [Hyphomicrobiales bacterium]MBV8439298.1 hypothetical protein [Hyphomicrobiales bacterium]